MPNVRLNCNPPNPKVFDSSQSESLVELSFPIFKRIGQQEPGAGFWLRSGTPAAASAGTVTAGNAIRVVIAG